MNPSIDWVMHMSQIIMGMILAGKISAEDAQTALDELGAITAARV